MRLFAAAGFGVILLVSDVANAARVCTRIND
jgi:hypothetical protein